MDPARHKVLWDGKDVTLTVTEFLILEALAQRPGVVKSPQPAARRRLSGRRLCRRPHDRQPHQAHSPQVPRRRPRIRCDRDPVWRRIQIRRRMTRADLGLRWSGRWTLAHRILAVNVLTVAPARAERVYLDTYRNRLSKERAARPGSRRRSPPRRRRCRARGPRGDSRDIVPIDREPAAPLRRRTARSSPTVGTSPVRPTS